MCKRIVTVIALVVVWLLSGNAHGEELFPFGARIDTGELPLRGGVVNCTLVITPNVDLADITIELREADSLEYIGPNQFDCSGKAGDTCRHTFDVVIPDSVLSGVQFVVRSGKLRKFCSKYFAPVDDRVIVFSGNPRVNSSYRNPYLPEKKQKVYTPEDHEGVYTGPTVTRIPGEKKPVFNDLTRAQHRPGYYSAPTISKIKDTTGLVQFAGADYDPADSSMMMLIRGDTVVARMPKDLFFKHYMPNQQTETDNGHIEPTKKGGKGTPR